jgi:hypothetical protein
MSFGNPGRCFCTEESISGSGQLITGPGWTDQETTEPAHGHQDGHFSTKSGKGSGRPTMDQPQQYDDWETEFPQVLPLGEAENRLKRFQRVKCFKESALMNKGIN